MGAKKSTKAKILAVEKNAALLFEDEWLLSHYPDQISSFDDYLKFSALIKPFVRSHVHNIIHLTDNSLGDRTPGTSKDLRSKRES